MSIALTEQPAQMAQPQPRRRFNLSWQALGFVAALVTSAALNLWALDRNGYSNEYYAAAVKSMLQSWHNFFFAAFDPSGFVTIDKPPFAFWIEAAFAKVLGFNGVSLLLPSALAGVASVALLYTMVKRYFGQLPALIAAFMLAITPISVVMNRDNNPDSMLTLAVMAAAWATLRAATTGRLRWLALAGVLVGIGFNIKMLEAWIILPALGLTYFLFANTSWRKRFIHLAAFGLIAGTISLSWMVAVDLTPASDRPYVGGSTNNSELQLSLGYNGLGRITGNETGMGGNRPGQSDRTPGDTSNSSTPNGSTPNGTTTPPQGANPFNGGNFGGPGGQGGPGGPGGFGGATGLNRLVRQDMGGEASWFLPLAIMGLVLGGWQTWRRFPQKQIRARRFSALMLWGGWLGMYFVVFSFAQGIFHSYYLVIFAPAVAALAGIGVDALWHAYRKGGWQSLFLPGALVANAAYCVYLLNADPTWQSWLIPAVIGISAVSALLLVGLWLVRRAGNGRIPAIVVALALVGLWLGPASWAVNATQRATTGSIMSGYPSGSEGMGRGMLNGGQRDGNGFGGQPFGALPGNGTNNGQPFGGSPGGGPNMGGNGQQPGGQPGGSASSTLIAYLEAHNAGQKYLVAVSSSQVADSIILQSNVQVMTLGGFSGSDNTISLDDFKKLVANGDARYVLGGGGGPGGGGENTASQISTWAAQTCKLVDTSAASAASAASEVSATSGASANATGTTASDTTQRGFRQEQLYDCAGAA